MIEWRHDLCFEVTKKRYINDQEMLRLAHAEIVNLFFPQETSDESDDINSETSDKSSKFSLWAELTYHQVKAFWQCDGAMVTKFTDDILSRSDFAKLTFKEKLFKDESLISKWKSFKKWENSWESYQRNFLHARNTKHHK